MLGRRLRCQMMPSSMPYSSVASCASGTLRPLSVGTARLPSSDRLARSSSGPRSRISISSLPSRKVLTVVPDSEPRRNSASCAELTPSARARSWSMFRRTTLLGSSQSRLTLSTLGLARTLAATSRARRRTSSTCSPETRNWIGKPTGGPFSSRVTRPCRSGKSLARVSISPATNLLARLRRPASATRTARSSTAAISGRRAGRNAANRCRHRQRS